MIKEDSTYQLESFFDYHVISFLKFSIQVRILPAVFCSKDEQSNINVVSITVLIFCSYCIFDENPLDLIKVCIIERKSGRERMKTNGSVRYV
jgi:hypothetical protein